MARRPWFPLALAALAAVLAVSAAAAAPLAATIEAWPGVQWLARSTWAYPVVSSLHIVGIALLLGATVVLDARLLGFARQVPIEHVASAAWPFSVAGVALAVATGPVLFVVQPSEYIANPAFFWKLGLLAAALANVALFHASFPEVLSGRRPIERSVRVHAAASIALWLAVLFAGRMIAFV